MKLDANVVNPFRVVVEMKPRDLRLVVLLTRILSSIGSASDLRVAIDREASRLGFLPVWASGWIKLICQ